VKATIVGARGREFACGRLQIVLSKHTPSFEPERFSARKFNKMQSLPGAKWHDACISISGPKMSARYRIQDPTIAMFQEDGRYVAHTVASGTVVEVCGDPLDGDRLVEVIWDRRPAMMFTQDLRSRAERLD
jgi:hypothetical protein